MHKLLKLFWLLRAFRELRGGRHHSHGGYHPHSREYYPLYGRRTSLKEQLLRRLLLGRRY